MKVKCWIPTATGNLSFSAIGTSSLPKRLLSLWVDRKQTQSICVIQERRTTDALFGRVGDGVNALRGRESKFCFCFFGTVHFKRDEDTHEVLLGISLIIPNRLKKPLLDLSKKFQSKIEDSVRGTGKEARKFWASQEFKDLFNKLKLDLAKLAEEGGFSPIATRVLRDGSTSLGVDERIADDDAKVILNQTYFFLRDVAHAYQHHEEDSDSILLVYPEIDEIGRDWRERVLFALHRWIIQQKRRKDHTGYERAVGIMAYAEVFRENICSPTLKSKSIERFCAGQLSQSLKAAAAEKAIGDNSSRNIVAFSAAIFSIGVLPITLLAGSAKTSDSLNFSYEVLFLNWIHSGFNLSPIGFSLLYLSLICVLFGVLVYYQKIRRNSFVRDVFRLTVSFGGILGKLSRGLFGGLLICSGAVLFFALMNLVIF